MVISIEEWKKKRGLAESARKKVVGATESQDARDILRAICCTGLAEGLRKVKADGLVRNDFPDKWEKNLADGIALPKEGRQEIMGLPTSTKARMVAVMFEEVCMAYRRPVDYKLILELFETNQGFFHNRDIDITKEDLVEALSAI